MIKRAGFRLSELCSKILAYSRPDRTKRGMSSLDAMCQETIELLQVVLPANVNLKPALDVTEPLLIDFTNIQQVLVNAIVNAVDAIGRGGGTVHLTCGYRTCDHAYLSTLHLSDVPPVGDYAFFEVSDTGAGIPQSILSKIFVEPVTTKKVGHGQGMMVVADIVREDDGFVGLVSIPGKGTRFSVFFPPTH